VANLGRKSKRFCHKYNVTDVKRINGNLSYFCGFRGVIIGRRTKCNVKKDEQEIGLDWRLLN